MANLEKPYKRDHSSDVSGKVSQEKPRASFGFVVVNSNEASETSHNDNLKPEKTNKISITPHGIEVTQLGMCEPILSDSQE
jgi:hypothetical protein